jgi:hypothetical protein
MNTRWGSGLSFAVLVFGFMVGFDAGPALGDSAGSCAKPSDVEIVQLLNRWRMEFTAGSTDRLSALYADDAILIPTKDSKPYKGKEAIRGYYKDLLARHPTVSIKPSSLTSGCGTAAVSGPVFYRLAGERKGTRTLLGGRYTTEFGLLDGSWRIMRHSLAADPRNIGEPIDKAVSGSSPPL